MSRSPLPPGDRIEQNTDQPRAAKKVDTSEPFHEPGLTPGSYQNDPDHHGSHGGYWEREEAHGTAQRRVSKEAADARHSRLLHGEGERRQNDRRGRGPRNYRRSDDRIADDVHQRLSDDHHLDASDIEVSVSEREVTLSGWVDSRRTKQHAEDCADTVSGVEHVQNNLRVRKPREQTAAIGS